MNNRNASAYLVSSLLPFLIEKHSIEVNGVHYKTIPDHPTEVTNETIEKREERALATSLKSKYTSEVQLTEEERKGCLATLRKIWGGGNKSASSQIVSDLGLPKWIDLASITKNHGSVYKGRCKEMAEFSKAFHEPEKKVKFRQVLMWQLNNRLIMEVAFGSQNNKENKALVQGFSMILECLSTLVSEFENEVDCPLVAEIAHGNLKILYNMFDGKTNKRKVEPAVKAKWIATIGAIKAKVHEMRDIPKGALYFEVDMLERGVEMVKEKSQFLKNLISKGIGGTVRMFATGDPTALLSCIKDGVMHAAKKGLTNYRAQSFKISYWIDGFKTWVILQKLKVADLELRNITLMQIEDEPEDDIVDIIETIKAGLKKFEKEILEKSNYWQISYQWVKSLGEMIMMDTILFDEQVWKYVKKEAKVTERVTLATLEKLGWLNKVSAGTYILNSAFPGKIKEVTDEKNNAIKQAIRDLRLKAVSDEVQKFLYFGGEGFQGLKHWATFGEDKEDSWAYKLEDAGRSIL